MAYFFEFIVLNIFAAYRYKPRIFKISYHDNIFGAALSQAIFVPFTAVFMNVNKANWKIKLLFSTYFILVERIFLSLKIFYNRWWKTRYTAIFITIFFFLNDQWFYLLKKKNSIVQYLSLFFMTLFSVTNYSLALTFIRKFRLGFGRFFSWKEHFAIKAFYCVLISIPNSLFIKMNDSWRGALAAFGWSLGLDLLLVRLKLVKAHRSFYRINPINHMVLIGMTKLFYKYIYKDLK
ncbi:hypothetical protein GH754_19295 [Salinibacillus xinjiangensis]|uniref:Uncharacterized protein n=2 Tax=Salinibacillus xinjiangensis TaxID=1229268 RepID=A0A6G1XBM8_9BACI|nr:hypothetical protein [Salinibacillus xinjiangensis]